MKNSSHYKVVRIGLRKRCFIKVYNLVIGFPGDSVVKNLPSRAGDVRLMPALGRSPGEGNGNPLQYSCLENPMDGGAWQATVHRDAKELDTT